MSASQSSPQGEDERPSAIVDSPELTSSGESPPRIDVDSLNAAAQAVQSAYPFAQLIYQKFSEMSGALRDGNDQDALFSLSDSTKDLSDFFQFVILVREILKDHFTLPELQKDLESYQDRLLSGIESLNPALSDLDLVEVADIIEHDILPTLDDYAPFHEALTLTLQNATSEAA